MLIQPLKLSITIGLLLCLTLISTAQAQHPVEVQKYLAQGEYFEALKTYYALPKRRISNETRIAAAKSAWALSLTSDAIAEFDQVLRDPNLDPVTRADVTLIRGVIEFQEGRFQEANLYAEKAYDLLPQASALRARALILWGQALLRAKAYGAAEEKFSQAITEASDNDLSEAHYWAGNVRYKLGQLDLARKDFESIPMGHDRTAGAIRYLARIALDTRQYKSVEFWLTKGRAEYPDQFLDSWVDYALVQVASHNGDYKAISSQLERIRKDFPASDSWVPLVEAEAELGSWRARASDSTLSNSNKNNDVLTGGANVSN